MDLIRPLVVACIPAFNEERYVASVLVRLRECVDRVIVCGDGSVSLVGRSGGRGGCGGPGFEVHGRL